MASSAHIAARYVTVCALLVTLVSIISVPGHSATSPSTHDSLQFTVYPNKSVAVNWNTTTSLPINQSMASLFQGYSIQSTSSFSQQTNAVVETTNVQYQLPPQVYTQAPFSLVDSVSLSASQSGNTSSGSLTLTTGLAVQSVNVVFATSPSRVSANTTAQLYFSGQTYLGPALENQANFTAAWMKTFQNATWRGSILSQIKSATNHSLIVDAFNGTATPTSSTAETVNITFIATPNGTSTDFVTAYENSLASKGTPLPNGFDAIIRSALKLVTGESLSLNYSNQTGKLTIVYTTNFVSNLDAQLNTIKNQFFQIIMNAQPVGTITPQEIFLNDTSITVTKTTVTSNLDLSAGTYNTALSGFMLNPPVVGTSTNFTIPGLFQTLGGMNFSSPGVNITLSGGSDSSNQVKIVVPPGTPTPSSTTSNSATWTNVKNATVLQNVQFQVSALPFSFFAFLTSPTGFAVEAIIVAAIIAGILLYARSRRAKTSTSLTPSGPTPSPGFGPSPGPPTQ